MKTFRYDEPDENGSNIAVTVTEDEIIDRYWDFWCEAMKKVDKGHLISRENCIEDFCVIHWAWEVEPCGA